MPCFYLNSVLFIQFQMIHTGSMSYVVLFNNLKLTKTDFGLLKQYGLQHSTK